MEHHHEVKSIYEAHKLTGLSVSSLINAVDKGNAILTRRKDKQRFILYWQSIHERCFQIRREVRWLETRRRATLFGQLKTGQLFFGQLFYTN